MLKQGVPVLRMGSKQYNVFELSAAFTHCLLLGITPYRVCILINDVILTKPLMLLFFRLEKEVHLGSTFRTNALCLPSTLVVSNHLRILHHAFGLAFHTVGLVIAHIPLLLFVWH